MFHEFKGEYRVAEQDSGQFGESIERFESNKRGERKVHCQNQGGVQIKQRNIYYYFSDKNQIPFLK